MKFEIIYRKEALRDLNKLNHSQRANVLKAIQKVSKNPLPFNEGGYGKPLGNLSNSKLSGLLKIKLKKDGIRIVYQLRKTENTMKIIVIGMRKDNEVYETARRRMLSEE